MKITMDQNDITAAVKDYIAVHFGILPEEKLRVSFSYIAGEVDCEIAAVIEISS